MQGQGRGSRETYARYCCMYVYRHDLDDTEEADDMYYDNPSEGIDAASNTNAVEGVHQAANRGALDDVDIAAPGYGCGRESGPTFGMDLR